MGESWSIILLLIPLIAGAIAVFFSFRLMKRFPGSHTNSYFYYLVFLYIFGVYSLAGSGILQYTLHRMDVDQQVIRSAGFYTLLLGVPFLFLSKFMIYKFTAELRGISLSPVFTTSYFLAGITLFVGYGVMIVRLNRYQLGDYELLVLLHRTGFISMMALIYMGLFFWGWRVSRTGKDQEQIKFIRLLTSWYLLYTVFTIISFALIPVHPLIPYIFLFLFLSWHLVPILFINLYLEKHHEPRTSHPTDFESRLDAIVASFEISPRETEVIRLICRGMSNQEISNELYISLQTVKDHVHRIFIKTGVKNRVQLTNLIRTK